MIALALLLAAVVADPPRITALEPTNGAVDLDATATTRLVVTFDRDMATTGFSFCGGGPEFPKVKGRPSWETPRRIVVEVELEPDHDYRLGLNCPAATNFRSTGGVPLAPVPWSFSTAPAVLPDPAKQKAENRKALDALEELLPRTYSHHDLRVKSWPKLFREHRDEILGARTTRGWAAATARMLAATEDLHLYLKLDGRVFPAGTRAVDPLFRREIVPKYVPVQPLGANGLQGRTPDGIAYLMIPAWEDPKEVDAVEAALATLRDAKALVVDVRPNSGGDELLARRVAAWFVEGTRVYARNRSRTKAGKNGFGPVYERSLTGNEDREQRLDVPIAVLTSRYVMSSNESFVQMLRQAKECTVVGQRTYGSSGNPKPHELPNGVTILVPSWQDLLPDGTCNEGVGLAPDVEVAAEPADFEKADPILAKALELLRERLAKR